MEHCVTIGANWSQIVFWINFVFAVLCGNWTQMVNMNKSCAYLAVAILEIHSAHKAINAVVSDTLHSCLRIPLAIIDNYRLNGPLD